MLALTLVGAIVAVPAVVGGAQVPAAPAAGSTAAGTTGSHELGVLDALVLGVVEGITEFLPVSSTGHLLVTGRLLDLDGSAEGDPVAAAEAKDAFDSYAIAIQAGAILAVLALYWRRVLSVLNGVIGRDAEGRRLALNLIVAFVPAAVIGLALEGPIKDRLFQPWAIAVAWAVGGVVILVLEQRRRVVEPAVLAVAASGGANPPAGAPLRSGLGARWAGGSHSLDQLSVRMALVVGCAQVFAMWPGTSRSLVTILAGMAVGLGLSAAVELSFLLGLLTLGAATSYEALNNGSVMIDAYGVGRPLLGLLAALVSALLAVKWMVAWLQRRGLAVFGWYRLGAAAALVILLAGGVL